MTEASLLLAIDSLLNRFRSRYDVPAIGASIVNSSGGVNEPCNRAAQTKFVGQSDHVG